MAATKLAAINMTVDIVVSVALYKPLGIAGLVIGTASANIVMALLQLRRLRIGFNGRLDLQQTVMITARILVVSAMTGVIARLVWELLNSVAGASIAGQIVSVGGAIAAAAASTSGRSATCGSPSGVRSSRCFSAGCDRDAEPASSHMN